MKKAVGILILFYLLFSCTRSLEFDLDFENPLVINCIMEQGKQAELIAYQSIDFVDSFHFERICDLDATLSILSTGNESTFVNSTDNLCYYTTQNFFLPLGESVKLNVTYGSNTYSASTSPVKEINASVNLDEFKLIESVQKQVWNPEEQTISIVRYNSYQLTSIVTDNSNLSHRVGYSFDYKDGQKRNKAICDFKDIPYFRNNDFFDDIYAVSKEISTENLFHINVSFSLPDSIEQVKVYSKYYYLNEELFDYISINNAHAESFGDPFVTPIPPYTNIENGLGIFAAYNVKLDSFLIDLPD